MSAQVCAIVAAHAWKEHQAVALTADELATLGDGVVATTLTFRGVHDGAADFLDESKLVRDGLRNDLTTTVRVDVATGRVDSIEAQGRAHGTLHGAPALGSTHSLTTFSYQ